jgi:hypothetical protein
MGRKHANGSNNAQSATPSQGAPDIKDISATIAELEELSVAGLQAKWLETFGEAARSRNRSHLIKKLAWRIQEQAEGGLSAEAMARIDELVETTPTRQRGPRKAKVAATTTGTETTTGDTETPPQTPVAKERDSRLPPAGTVLRPKHRGREFAITVLDEGFEMEGFGHFKSLSAAGRAACGVSINGYLWCGLIPKAVHIAQAEKGGEA